MAKLKKAVVLALCVAILACVGSGAFFLGKTAARRAVPTWRETDFLYATFLELRGENTLLVQGSSVNREDQQGQYLLTVDHGVPVKLNGVDWPLEDMFPGMRLSITYQGEIRQGQPGEIPHVLAIVLQGNLTDGGHWSYEEELP